MNRARWIAGIVSAAMLLSLGMLPSAAQEATPPAKTAPPPAQSPPAEAQKPDADAPEPEEAEEQERTPEERVSADNNLSFPVDI